MKTSKITSYFTPSYQNLHAFVCERCDAAQSFNSSTDEDFQICNSCQIPESDEADFQICNSCQIPESDAEDLFHLFDDTDFVYAENAGAAQNLLFSLPTELQREIFDYGKKLATKKLIDELKARHHHFNSYVPFLPTYYGKYEATALNHYCHGYRNFMKALDKSNGWN